MTKGGAATAGVAAVGLLLAGCNPGGDGVRTEGSATGTPAPKGAVSASPVPSPAGRYKKVDAVELLKHDPKVGTDVKKSLAKPCAADEYPVEVTYASLTGNKAPDVIINVMTCADSVGLGAYVFRKQSDGGYDNVYRNEQPSVSAGVNKGGLEVSVQTYDADDQVCCPSGEDVLTYRWSDDRFTPYGEKSHTDYSKTTVDDAPVPVDGTGSEG
ncbi:hypothetical protein ACIRPT_14880 [Streptomyces sp. NPDC101227]|uniref:hypothetical protein n=1 Tax=Streptomyces sp. NPDC101227 TaxID=3366136 RepID=UPI003814C63B